MSAERPGHCKLCELEDFRDADLRAVMQDVCLWNGAVHGGGEGDEAHKEAIKDLTFPDGQEHRKSWELAMTARAFRDLGVLRDDAEVLGVGAGRESTIFWLTRHVRRVFATDLYLTEDSWSVTDSGVRMLVAPGEWLGSEAWNPRRLVVQHMNALELNYEDESFDGIFSSSSIEHFGELPDVRRSVEEIYRVLRPGGVLALATEYRLAGPPPGMPGVLMLDQEQLEQVLLDGLDWETASPLDLSISDATLSVPQDFDSLSEPPSLAARAKAHLLRKPASPTSRPTSYPHLVLRRGELLWTSVHLALVKPGA